MNSIGFCGEFCCGSAPAAEEPTSLDGVSVPSTSNSTKTSLVSAMAARCDKFHGEETNATSESAATKFHCSSHYETRGKGGVRSDQSAIASAHA